MGHSTEELTPQLGRALRDTHTLASHRRRSLQGPGQRTWRSSHQAPGGEVTPSCTGRGGLFPALVGVDRAPLPERP